MISFSIHNVTKFDKARVSTSGHDKSGWLVLNAIAEDYSWDRERPQDQIGSEVTFFMKNMDLGLAQLQDAITLAVARHRREQVELALEKEAKAKEATENE
tara:strand:+ start:2941 stop:3240 length:300 start_codon:yes stop_codon:yes gene_type:complete